MSVLFQATRGFSVLRLLVLFSLYCLCCLVIEREVFGNLNHGCTMDFTLDCVILWILTMFIGSAPPVGDAAFYAFFKHLVCVYFHCFVGLRGGLLGIYRGCKALFLHQCIPCESSHLRNLSVSNGANLVHVGIQPMLHSKTLGWGL